MADLTGASVLRRRPDVRYRVIDGEAVVIRQSAAEVLVINEVGARILALADGSAPIASWARTLVAEYDTEEPVLLSDLLAFAGDLLASGVLEDAGGPGSGGPDGV
jgi:hypothetical protein